MEETLSLTEILALFIKKAKAIIIFAIIGAVVLGGFQFIRQISAISSSVDNTTYQDDLANYQVKQDVLTASIDRVDAKMLAQKNYSKNSILKL